MRRGGLSAVCVMVGACIGGQAAVASVSNTVRLSYSARQAGMGGVCRSLADDGIAPLCNPAGMGFQEGRTLDLNGALGLTNLHYEDPQNDARSGGEGDAGVSGLPDFGFTHHVGHSPFAYGLGFYTYGASRMKYDINSTLLVSSGSEATDNNLTLIHQRIMPAVAVQVTDDLALGAAYVRAYQTTAGATPLQFQTTVKPAGIAGEHVFLDADTDGWGQGGAFGALVKLGKRTRAGVSYTMPMRVKLKGRSEITVRNSPVFAALGIPEGTRANYATSITWKWPQVLGLGISHEPNEQWLFAFDWQWFDWSWAADKIELIFSEGNNALVNSTLQSVTGTNTIRDQLKLQLRDAFVYHFGTEYRPSECLALRAGYIFSTNPVPDGTVRPLVNGNVQHTIALGAGTKVRAWDVDVAWSHTYLNEQVVEFSEVQGGENNFSQTSAGGDLFSLTLRKRF